MDVIDLTVETIDLTNEGVQDFLDLIEQNKPEHDYLNGYISDDGFVVGPGESESGVDEDEAIPHLPDMECDREEQAEPPARVEQAQQAQQAQQDEQAQQAKGAGPRGCRNDHPGGGCAGCKDHQY